MKKYVDVILPLPLPKSFTYSLPDECAEEVKIGCRVVVPFGRKKFYTAIVLNVHYCAPTGGVAILSSLHDLNQALCLGDKFFLLRDGAVRYAGDEGVLTSEVIGDIFDIQSRIITVDGKKVILGGKYYEES